MIIIIDENNVWIKVGAGENWHVFVLYCIEHNWAGIENLSLIPGTVGATPIQNIGAYGVEVKDAIDEVIAFEIETKECITIPNSSCHFAYRESIFKKGCKGQYTITEVIYKLDKKPTFHVNYGAIQEIF